MCTRACRLLYHNTNLPSLKSVIAVDHSADMKMIILTLKCTNAYWCLCKFNHEPIFFVNKRELGDWVDFKWNRNIIPTVHVGSQLGTY